MKPYKLQLISGSAQVNLKIRKTVPTYSIDSIAGKLDCWATAVVISNVIHFLTALASQNFG